MNTLVNIIDWFRISATTPNHPRTDNNTAVTPASKPTLQNILEVVLQTEKKLDTGRNQGSYVVAARRGNASTPTEAPPAKQEPIRQPLHRELKSFVVQIKNSAEAVGIWRVARTELLGRMRTPTNRHTAAIVEVCQMASGDLLIGTTTEEARKGLEEDQQWLRGLSTSATICRKVYTVMAHGIQVARVNTSNQASAIAEIERQNHALHPGLKIERVLWPKTAEGKPVSTLHLDLFCPMAANRLLEEGLLEDLCAHTCKVFNRAAHLTQCFRCQAKVERSRSHSWSFSSLFLAFSVVVLMSRSSLDIRQISTIVAVCLLVGILIRPRSSVLATHRILTTFAGFLTCTIKLLSLQCSGGWRISSCSAGEVMVRVEVLPWHATTT